MSEPNGFSGWMIVELLGHVRMAGLVTEEEHFGAKLGRIEIPSDTTTTTTTQYFGGGSIYRITPTTEAIARAVAAGNQAAPIHRWELPALPSRPATPDESGRADHDDIFDEQLDDIEDNEYEA